MNLKTINFSRHEGFSNIIRILFVCCITFSCKSDQSEKLAENIINMNDAQSGILYSSDYIESFEYVPLETKEECLVGNNPIVYVTNDFIITNTIREKKCFLFDRSTGKFIREIGNSGQGPEEYLYVPSGIIVNEQEKTIIFDKGERLIEYSLNDGYAISISAQTPPLSVNKLAYMTNGTWAIGFLNSMGNAPTQLLFFDRKEILDSVPNDNTFTPKPNNIFVNRDEFLFYRYDNSVYYKYLFNDTIFKIVDYKLRPEWIFEMKESLQKLNALRNDPDKLFEHAASYHFIYPIIETDGYILFNSRYQTQKHAYLFDKELRQLQKLEHESFVNDIDGGLTFWPISTNQNQELISIYQAHFIKEEINKNVLGEQNVKNNSAFKKLRTLIFQLDEDDNPVVVIAKFKK